VVERRCSTTQPAPNAYVFERTRSIADSERRDLLDRFLAIYPEWVLRPDGLGPPYVSYPSR
jgi:hypothetical protein